MTASESWGTTARANPRCCACIAGELAPDSGRVEIGTTVKIGHFSQEGRELDLNQRVYDFIHDIADEVRTDEGTFTAKAR